MTIFLQAKGGDGADGMEERHDMSGMPPNTDRDGAPHIVL